MYSWSTIPGLLNFSVRITAEEKIHSVDSEEVEKAVYKWFLDTRSKNIALNGRLLCGESDLRTLIRLSEQIYRMLWCPP